MAVYGVEIFEHKMLEKNDQRKDNKLRKRQKRTLRRRNSSEVGL